MSSLRARLVLGLLALTAAGLLVVAATTYVEQRSFLLGRVDQQLSSSVSAVTQALAEQGYSPGAGGPGDHGGFGHGGPRAGDSGSTADLPPGTYGQSRTSAGAPIGHVVLSYGATPLPAPSLPADLGLGKTITVASAGSSRLRYRALAQRNEDGSITIVAIPLHEVDQTLTRLLEVEGIEILGVLVALGLLAWLVVRIGLRPLDRIARTAGAIAAGDLSHRVAPATPRTEVGRLGIALNTMLDRLQAAFGAQERSEQRLRQFLADASHELRTPLASIRGSAELFRMGAAADPDDLVRTMRRIEDEAARMGVLVEDLLTLARLDAVREPVREPVDVAELARTALDAAEVVVPDRTMTLDAPAELETLGDRHQLRQVLDNLLRNAVTHTPEGTPVEVTVARVDEGAQLRVRDYGPGLPPGDPADLFERFSRAQAGRGRGKGGAGLGLAIVGAIVDAHGGRVAASDAPGGGALFVVSLPAADPGSPTARAAVLPTAGVGAARP